MSKTNLTIDDPEYLEQLRQRKVFPLHLHWDGSISFKTLWDFYQERGESLSLPEKYIDGTLIKEDRAIKTPEQLLAFRNGIFSKYNLVDVFKVPTMAMQSAEDQKTMAVAHCRYLQPQNIVYAETRFAPWYHSAAGKRGSNLTMDEVIGYALEGFAQGKEETGVTVKLIICVNREKPDAALEIVKAALNFAERGVVGIDLACYEPLFPPELFADAFAQTFDSPLKRTVHANEMCPEEQGLKNIYTALTQLRADGISHALHLYKRPDLIELMLRNNVRLESNPISNLTCSFIDDLADLHLEELVKEGVLVTVNPDDPAMWPNGDLVHNLYFLGKMYGDEFVDRVIRNSIIAAWGLSDREKRDYLQE